MQLTTLLLPSVLISFAAPALGATFASKAVKPFTGPAFKKAIKASSKASMVVYYAPWCGHCKALGPEFDKAADNLKGLANLVAIDCDAEINKPYCGEMAITGFPTIKFFPGGSAPPEDYQGERKASPIVSFITSRMPTFAKPLTSPSALAALPTTKPVVVLFTSATKVTPLYKALSAEFRKTFDFFVARDEKVGTAGMEDWGVTRTPGLVFRDAEGKKEKYDGALKYDEIKAFLSAIKEQLDAKSQKAKDEL